MQDIIYIKDLRVQAIIGIFGWEREVRQEVSIDLEFPFDCKKAAKTDSIEEITFERALDYLSLPKELGSDPESGEKILVTIGPYGPYFKRGSKNFRGRKGLDPFSVDLEEALASISSSKGSGALKTFDDSPIKIVDGRWGAYVTDGKKNASVPKDREPEELELQECLDLLEKAPAKKKRKRKSKKGTK